MKLTLQRICKTKSYTEGSLTVDNVFFCHTLEDTTRNLTQEAKIIGRTAIPEGTYCIQVTFSPKFKRLLPLIVGVPHFSGIRIHRGNTPNDTSGCILVGEKNNDGTIKNSTVTEEKLTALLLSEQKKGNTINITVL